MRRSLLTAGRYSAAAVALLVAPGALATELPAGFTRAMVAGVSTRDLAIRLIGEGEVNAAGVERHEIEPPHFRNGPLRAIRFFGRPRPTAADICEQGVYFVGFSPIRDGEQAYTTDSPTRVSSVSFMPHITLADDCRVQADQRFLRVQWPVSVEQATMALRTLRQFRAAAEERGSLGFLAGCRDEARNDACADGGRTALAALPLHQAFLIARTRAADEDGFDVTLGTSNAAHWIIRLTGMLAGRPTITMLHRIPPPF